MKRNEIINPEKFDILTGENDYFIDLPDGDCQVKYHIRSDASVTLWACCEDKKRIPLETGNIIEGVLRIQRLKGLGISAAKKTVVAVQVYHREMKLIDPINDKPVEVAMPEPLRITLNDLVSRAVGDALRQQNQGEDVEIELDELFEDDIDPEFGYGHMEPDTDFEPHVGGDPSDNGTPPSVQHGGPNPEGGSGEDAEKPPPEPATTT